MSTLQPGTRASGIRPNGLRRWAGHDSATRRERAHRTACGSAGRRPVFIALIATAAIAGGCRRQEPPARASHADGPSTTESSPARRIVTLSPGADEVLCALGAAEQIVGVSSFTTYPTELIARPRVGGLFDPDLEAILSLNPDLIVVRGHNATLEDFARHRGIRLYHDPTEGLDDLRTCIRDLGERVGRPADAAATLNALNARLDAVRRSAEARRGGRPRPRVLMTLARSPGELKDILTGAAGTTHDEMLRLAGATNVFGDVDVPYPTVSLEQVVVRAPEIIIELMPEVRMTAEVRSRIVAQWAPIACPAVESGRIFILGDELAHSLTPSLRTPEVAERIAEILWAPEPRS